MSVVVEIGDERCAIEGPAVLCEAVRARFAGFVSGAPASARLRVSIAPGFRGDYAAPVSLDLRLDGDRLVFTGAACGEVDLARGDGVIDGIADLGALDAALRALASARAPARGALLLHGLVAPVPGGAIVLCGESGAGKSTAARALDAACDEIVAVHAGHAIATPYWGGRRFAAPLVAIGVLTHGAGEVITARGADAIRALSPHVVRYVPYPPAERATLALLASLASLGVHRILAPTGPAFLPFLADVTAGWRGAPAQAVAR